MSPKAEKELMQRIEVLPETHQDTFRRALRNILSSDVAEHTCAQILDGLPTEQSYLEGYVRLEGHPVFELGHTEMCQGFLDKAREFRDRFDPSELVLKENAIVLPQANRMTRGQLLSAFRDTVPGSHDFNLRLIELVVVACHQIAAYLFELDDGVHKHEVYDSWMQQQLMESVLQSRPGKAKSMYNIPPAAFFHLSYVYPDQYPRGVADVAGYWAEGKIFGGVVVFDRGETEQECKAMWIHGARLRGPRTLYPPTQDQFDSLVKFLLARPGEDAPCPLPIYGTPENRPRWHPYHALAKYHIFRDKYERQPGPEPPKTGHRGPAPADWPEMADYYIAFFPDLIRNNGGTLSDQDIADARARLAEATPSSPFWYPLVSN
ncbi:hypothetical protein N0V84_011045 [Fusarium piperis]|uniref:Uncharacterized protein n=1 Tax=Fusarium piperis TaxID=1435070 RepID=A0A9W8TCP4_9HYPO|nr:hypothetical protein N0V84_011045 [Fusarium piperis]